MQKRNTTPTGPAKARTTGRATASGHAAGLAPAGLAPAGLAPAGLAPAGLAPAASAGQVIDLATRWTAIRAWLDAGFHPVIAEAMASDPGASLRLLSEVGRAR